MNGFSYNDDEGTEGHPTVQRWASVDGRVEIVRCPSTYGSEDRFGLFFDGDLIVTAPFDYVTKYYWAEIA